MTFDESRDGKCNNVEEVQVEIAESDEGVVLGCEKTNSTHLETSSGNALLET